MILTVKLKLCPTPEQRELLLATLQQLNAACSSVSQTAWQVGIFQQFRLHHLVYKTIRHDFQLAAQAAIRVIGKVAQAYKKDRATERQFYPLGSMPYDDRLLTYHRETQQVSIWLLGGRQYLSYQVGEDQAPLLAHRHGETDLMYQREEFYLVAACEVPTPEIFTPQEVIGVDLGIANLAVDSDGEFHTGQVVKGVRSRYQHLRQKLQKKGTQSAKRLLRHRSGREARFVRNENHCISKHLVQKAQGTTRAIALENLRGIRERTTVWRKQRYLMHSWAFFDLKMKILYKAERLGVPVVEVDPRNSSRECSCCGYISQKNRTSQSQFRCKGCGFAAHADYNAALNLRMRGRGAVNHPHAGVA